MPRATTVNDALSQSLATYEEIEIFEGRLVPEICAALGMPRTGNLRDKAYPIVGFFIDAHDEAILSIYMVTPGRFILYEINQLGTSFTAVLPIERVRHMERMVTLENDSLVVEFDAQRSFTNTVFRESDEGGSTASATTTYAKYELIASTKTTSLDTFAAALSNTLGL
jgi:hypothetical protein